jgi:hypothetical protein
MKEECGCCDGIGIVTPVSECNPPGLSAITYRAGTYATFFETMLARLSNLSIEIPSVGGTGTDLLFPLKQLTARDASDPAIALLDAWAVLSDVLTFYQERIANEGYLPTAIERRSIVELAQLLGYRPRPGVAASVYLAFTTAVGFRGQLPAGTRAQSIPGPGELPQFFETSDPLEARDVWNAMKPRLTRQQFLTAPGNPTDPAVTDVSVIDTLYLDGTSTNLKTGDAILFVFGGIPLCLRPIEGIDAQSECKRTQVAFVPSIDLLFLRPIDAVLKFFMDKATYLFPGSALAENVSVILSTLKANLGTPAPGWHSLDITDPRLGLFALALAQLREQQALARDRKFSRVSIWIAHVVEFLPMFGLWLIKPPSAANVETAVASPPLPPPMHVAAMPSALASSHLLNLYNLTQRLDVPRSVQPADAVRLDRSIGRSFAPQSDMAPRLLAALKPTAADSLYPAWRAIPKPSAGIEAYAMRVKASLFAGRYPGAASIPLRSPMAIYTAPTIDNAWGSVPKDAFGAPLLPLDASFDQIKPGSWIAIDRPNVEHFTPPGFTSWPPRFVTYHFVVGVHTANVDSGTGYAATVTSLALAPNWQAGLDAGASSKTETLRDTIVYAQAEPLALSEEPLDTDVGQDTIALDGVYDGLEPGRWVIVSGNRTDVPNVSGVKASELAMLAGVTQGAEPPMCAAFPAGSDPPFFKILYTTPANAQGDRLVVGIPRPGFLGWLRTLPVPVVQNQEYCQQVELARGFFADAYVPTEAERNEGDFSAFQGLLTDPDTNLPLAGGRIPLPKQPDNGLPGEPRFFAWRISQKKLHTSLKLAAPMAYTYDTATVCVYGNVAKATHGQTVGEVLGDGDARQSFQTLALRQSPLTYISAPTPSGASSTLSVRVNELEWHERNDLTEEGPRDRTFITSASGDDKVSVIFGNGIYGARPPTGTANIKATYRYGIGAAGNVAAGKISQLATHPLGAQGVINPLPASGGADRDSADEVRCNAPMAVMALDRLVSVKDYADFSRTYAGIGKASAARLSDGYKQVVHVTVAGAHDIPIDVNSDLYNNLLQSLLKFGDPHIPVQIGLCKIKLLVVSARIRMLPDYQWEDVEPRLRAAMLDHFGFAARDLGQSAFLSEAVRVMQEVDGVSYVEVAVFDSVAEDVSAETLASLAGSLTLYPAVAAELAKRDPSATDPAQRILPAELVFLTPDIPDMLILTNIGA